MLSEASRVCLALVQLLVAQKNGTGVKAAHTLYRTLKLRMWPDEESDLLRQLGSKLLSDENACYMSGSRTQVREREKERER